ncbi:hypothetical protein K8R04_01755 [Candidatus Uhrbacteria bacterium]|nr:hypothetical protein [Candidatus Uhrbacteria bacterium]
MLERQSTSRSAAFHRHYPRRISYSTLLREIFKRIEDPCEAQKLVDLIRCHGVPGKWVVGIYFKGEERVVFPRSDRVCRDYNEGFAQLLVWLRHRNFQPFDS